MLKNEVIILGMLNVWMNWYGACSCPQVLVGMDHIYTHGID